MGYEHEHEIVSLLDQDNYRATLIHFDVFPSDAKPQTNHYFADPEGVLERNDITLRVREESGGLEVNLKIPLTHSKDGGMLEIRKSISDSEFEVFKKREIPFPKEIEDALEHLALESISYIGFAVTKRIKIAHKAVEGAWMIDETSFPLGYTDYRLELEHEKNYQHKARESMADVLKQTNTTFVVPVSKFKKFMEKIRENEKIVQTIRKGVEKTKKHP
jgi:uncharacterized protein YjbK